MERIVDPVDPLRDRLVVAASLRTFMHLPPTQRGSVILRDVLGYSVSETSQIMDTTIPAVKSALQRGRARLHELANKPEDVASPSLSKREREQLVAYVDRFNARDFDATLRYTQPTCDSISSIDYKRTVEPKSASTSIATRSAMTGVLSRGS